MAATKNKTVPAHLICVDFGIITDHECDNNMAAAKNRIVPAHLILFEFDKVISSMNQYIIEDLMIILNFSFNRSSTNTD